jgi:hypothetical protein
MIIVGERPLPMQLFYYQAQAFTLFFGLQSYGKNA